MTLTFDLLTYKYCHGSPVSWASFVPLLSLLRLSVLDLESDTELAFVVREFNVRG